MTTPTPLLIHAHMAVVTRQGSWFIELREARDAHYQSYSVVQGNFNPEMALRGTIPGRRRSQHRSVAEAQQEFDYLVTRFRSLIPEAVICRMDLTEQASESPIDGAMVRLVRDTDYRENLVASARRRGTAQIFG